MTNFTCRRGLIAAGLALLLATVALGGAPARAQELPPRPTEFPAATATPQPPAATAVPEPAQDGERAGGPAAPGRITGTVIDVTMGAPAPGIAVRVGDDTVLSDANGNYDRNGLAAGSYSVALLLAPGRGESVQGEVAIDLAAGQTVVQHLAFRSPVPQPAAPAQPEVSGEAAAPAPEAAAPAPASLPATAGDNGAAAPLALAGLTLLAAGTIARRRA